MGRSQELSPEELVERLRLNDEHLVDEVYSIAKRQLDIEERRDAVLNQKATSLLGVLGLSVTVTFTFGSMLLDRPALRGGGHGIVLWSYTAALAFGVMGSFFALLALLVRGTYRDVEEAEVFGPELKGADGRPGQPAVYRRFLAAHLWLIYRANSKEHDKKAKRIRIGQVFLFLFLLALLPIGGAMTLVISTSQPPTPSPKAEAPARATPEPAPASSPQPQGAHASALPPATAVPSGGRVVTLSQTPPRPKGSP
jgi:hypothetical protein